MAVVLLFFGLHEPEQNQTTKRTNPIQRANLKRLGCPCWRVVSIGAVFTWARFSEVFLVLRAQQGGVPVALVSLVMVAMNLVYALSAFPFGKPPPVYEPQGTTGSRLDRSDRGPSGLGS